MDRPVRVRFAPSPTGYLHIGGARTALFNYLYARKHDGVLVLRIEDTDRERSTEAAIQAILDGLRFLGIDWDEGPEAGGDRGPYFQSQRNSTYAPLVGQLLKDGSVYPCFCTRKRLDALRETQRAAKERIHYDRRCLNLSESEVREALDAKKPHVLRFKVPDGETVVDDLIRGPVVTRNEEIEDFVVRRSDGTVVYNFAVCGDDHSMGITHVIRGEDHLTNTSKQILLFQALGFEVPQYGHIPLILAPGGGKLSKRHGAVSVTEFAELGYLPEAMLNFLARIGWSYDDKEEIFSKDDLVEKFSLKGVSKSGAIYDLQKLEHLGANYMRERPTEDILRLALPYLIDAGFLTGDQVAERSEALTSMLALEKERVRCLSELPERVRYYFEDQVELDSGARKALRKKKDRAPVVEKYAESLASEVAADAWQIGNPTVLEEHARAFSEKENVKLGDIAQPVRALVTGRSATPGLFDVMAILGRDAVLRRLRRANELFAEAVG